MRRDDRFTRIEDRFSQIRVPAPGGRWSMGSGLLIGDGVIITARHVLLDPGPAAPPLSIEVRGARQASWEAAELHWPPVAELATGDSDIALVKLKRFAAADVASMPIGLDSIDERTVVLAVYATGFPAFESEPRDSHQINAQLSLHSGIRTATYLLNNVNLNTGNAGARSEPEIWAGFSGSPIIYERRLIGVVTRVTDQGRFDFRATRIDPLLEDKTFRNALPEGAILANVAEVIEVPSVGDYVYLLDRDTQESEFSRVHRQCCAAKPPAAAKSRAHVCILPGTGESRHEPYDFKIRLERKILHALEWPPGPIEFAPLPWPRRGTVADRLDSMRDDLWRLLCGEGPAPAEPEKFSALLGDASRLRTVYSELREQPLGADALAALNGWCAFLGEIDAGVNRPLTHLLLVRAGFGETDAWLSREQSPGDIRVHLLTELELCTNIELRAWLDRTLPAEPRRALEGVRGDIMRKFPDDFFVGELKLEVEDLVRRAAGG